MIKADEVIDMCVRYEDAFETQNFSRRQARDVAEIEHDRAPLEQSLDIKRRIAGSAVDQYGMQERSHGCLLYSAGEAKWRVALKRALWRDHAIGEGVWAGERTKAAQCLDYLSQAKSVPALLTAAPWGRISQQATAIRGLVGMTREDLS
jgi:hypothetical protein